LHGSRTVVEVIEDWKHEDGHDQPGDTQPFRLFHEKAPPAPLVQGRQTEKSADKEEDAHYERVEQDHGHVGHFGRVSVVKGSKADYSAVAGCGAKDEDEQDHEQA
jgi:hypothetical protein